MEAGLGMLREPINRCKNLAFQKPQRVLLRAGKRSLRIVLSLTIPPTLTIVDAPKDARSDVFALFHF